MSDDNLVRFVMRQLNGSLTHVRQEHSEKLRIARTVALEHQLKRSASRLATIGGLGHIDLFARRSIIWFIALLFITMGVAYWHAQSYIVELAEVDSAILIDEMPMDVITDKGFDTWLKSPAAR